MVPLMRLTNPSLVVLALAYYGQPLYPPTAPSSPTTSNPRNGVAAGRKSAIQCCQRWGLIDENNELTPRGLEVLQCSGKL